MTISYSARFQEKEAVASYDSEEYAPESHSTKIWQLQRPVVEKFLHDFARTQPALARLLDFACGTGRVLSCVESFADRADGIDVSENMVAVARARCRRARLQVGDILATPELLASDYDVITCFRLLLNLEPALRGRILRQLRAAIKPDGRLLVNMHGNSRSLRHPAIAWRRWQKGRNTSNVMLNEMSPAETEALLRDSGFGILHKIGFGVLPAFFYRTPLRHPAFVADRFLAGKSAFNDWSIDILYICHPC